MPLDAIVVGSGPNGLAAAIALAERGRAVRVYEAGATPGGGMRTRELTLPGFRHDVCSAVHPLAVGSPCFRQWPLEQYGLEWIFPPVAAAHPLEDAPAALLHADLARTAAELGPDGPAWEGLFAPHLRAWDMLLPELLAPLHWPRHPLALARFGLHGLRSAAGLAQRFRTPRARALLAGLAAHAIQPLESPGSAAIALVLGLAAFARGWPLPRGGAQALAEALAAHLRALGGELVLNHRVTSLAELPPARAVLLDVAPRQALQLAGAALPAPLARRLRRYRHGPAAFKLDWALSGPIPWADPRCAQAGTVHVGGTLREIASSERAAFNGRLHDRPYVLLTQPSLFDPTRAPAGRHTAWAYCHVPHGSRADRTDVIEAQIERFAPGFRALILARHVLGPAALEAYNPNYIGGDINCGVQDLRQLFHRPAHAWHPYRLRPGLYLCSAATPPGGGVHGMAGWHAAQRTVHDESKL